MQPGDTVLVRGGEHPEGEIWIRGPGHSGTLTQRKTITRYPGEEVDLTNASRPLIVDADYVTIAGFNFRNGKTTGAAGWTRIDQVGDKFIDNTFRGVIAYDTIGSHGNGHEIAGNVCDVSGSDQGTQGHCYYLSYGSDVRVRYNVASGPPGYGIHVFDQLRSTDDFQRVIRNLLIEGNMVKSSTERSGIILAMGDEGGLGNHIDGVAIRNNAITGNRGTRLRTSRSVRARATSRSTPTPIIPTSP